MVVVDLIVGDDVIGAAKLRFGMVSGVCAKEEHAPHDGFRIIKRLEWLLEVDFYSLRLAEADENRLAILFLIGECSERALQPQGVPQEV